MSASKPDIDATSGVETTGHEWDGIKELNNPLPRWWLILFYATIVFSIIYWVLFPAVPLLSNATPGMLGYSSRQAVDAQIESAALARTEFNDQIAQLSFDDIRADAALLDYARRSGASAFKIACVQCHGAGAAGSQELGYPNLNDDSWLWGGTPEDIYYTINHGIRNDVDPDARTSVMPAYGVLGMLDRRQISDVANYVLSLSGKEHDEAGAARGADTYATQCVACHGAEGEGNPQLGAPRLNDAIWLYGGSHDQLVAQIYDPHMGVMPPWTDRFDEATRKKLTLYVHSLGGGQ